MKKKTLPSIRVTEDTHSSLIAAQKKLNESSLVKMSFQDIRRICYEHTTQSVLKGEAIKIER